MNGFHRFLRPYLRRHFLAIAVESRSLRAITDCGDAPIIVYANHPSWWDPLIAHYIHLRCFTDRDFFAPIDSSALQQYRILEKLGFYAVELSNHSGAASFLKTSASILRRGNSAIWMTPEGRFADVRDHEAPLMPGLAHLCHRSERAIALPLALEYVFWDERLPVCLLTFGTPLKSWEHQQWSKSDWSTQLRDDLRGAQSRLADLAIRRSSEPFEDLLLGRRGGGAVYDSFRRLRAWLTGTPFRASHGDQFR